MRNTDGTFTDSSPGRPRREVEAGYLAALTDRVTPEDWGEIVTRAVTDAKKGDARAREWLAQGSDGTCQNPVPWAQARRRADGEHTLAGTK